jgi:hypothetical protein
MPAMATDTASLAAMAASDHIKIAVGIPMNAHRIIVSMFAITRDREAEPPDVQGLFRKNFSNASVVVLNDAAGRLVCF